MKYIYKEAADSASTPESNKKLSPSASRVIDLQKKSEFEIKNHYKKKLLLIDKPILNNPTQKFNKELLSPLKK